MECKNCKAFLTIEDKFCSNCGAKVPAKEAVCSKCKAFLKPEDKFCSECGQKVQQEAQLRCPACAALIQEGDKKCHSCGADLSGNSMAGPVWRPEPAKVDKVCAICEHFRKVIPPSSALPYFTGTAISQAMIKIEEDQVKQSVAEASFKAYLIETGKTRWDRRPIMTAYCAAKADNETYEVCEVKNRELNCPDFLMSTGFITECKNCLHLEPRNENPYPAQGPLTPELYEKKLESVDAEIALELTALWATKGVPNRKVLYHDFCTLHNIARPYVNIHKDCKSKFKYVAESEIFSAMRKRQKQ
jgi:RNA polymerase subunit RPABC4/transcription elongation factor Spt4